MVEVMKCEESEELIWIYDVLSTADRSRLDEHVEHCQYCSARVQEWQRSHRLIQGAFPRMVPEHSAAFTHRVMDAITGPKEQRRLRWMTPFQVLRTAMGITALVLVISFAYEFLRQPEPFAHAPVPATDAVVLNTSDFLEIKMQEGRSVGSIFSCVKVCRDDAASASCEDCVKKIKNFAL